MAVALKVMEPPAQMVAADGVIETAGVMAELTVTGMVLEVAVGVVAQAAVVVIVQETISPLLRLVVVKAGLFVPAGEPLMSH